MAETEERRFHVSYRPMFTFIVRSNTIWGYHDTSQSARSRRCQRSELWEDCTFEELFCVGECLGSVLVDIVKTSAVQTLHN